MKNILGTNVSNYYSLYSTIRSSPVKQLCLGGYRNPKILSQAHETPLFS